ncbi:MAG: redox-regulated ATPase YchF [Lentisphaeria bacterium]|nr:redox-regulated ATPase YchF [Lentisphaeria bacterium]
MNLGIIGLPQAGKKTVFQLLTGVEGEKAPTRDGIGYGIASVRDARIDRLTEMYEPKKTRYAEFEVALPPDVQPNAARSADWLEPIRRVDALVHVVRAFESDTVFHIEGNVDPARDLNLVETEFLLADLDLVEKRLTRMDKDKSRTVTEAMRKRERELLELCRGKLEEEVPLRNVEFGEEDMKIIRSLQFLTLKPAVVVFNTDEDLGAATETLSEVEAKLRARGAEVVLLSAAIELEIVELDAEEREAFMEDLGIEEPASHRLSRAAYECLGLMSFFTVGPDEVRAWPVVAGATAPEAAGKIHSDLERGFIRADTCAYENLIAAGSERAAREANHYRLNGKDYIVQDGDCLEIRFSV